MDKKQLLSAARKAVNEHYNCSPSWGCYKACRFGKGANTAWDSMECGADEFEEGFLKGVRWGLSQGVNIE